MSWQAADHIRRLRGVTAMEKAVLYSLADRHNTDEKGCWPRISLVAQDAAMSERSVQRILRKLEEKGVIRISPRKRKDGSASSNFYQFVGIDEIEGGGDTLSPGGDRLAPLEPINEPKKIRERYEQVFEKVPNTRRPINSPDRYFAQFSGDLDFDPRNVAAVIKVADTVRGKRTERLRVPALKFWPNLDRVGAFLRKENGRLNETALLEAFDTVFTQVVGNKGGEGWDNILDGVAQAPEDFFVAYREANQ